MSNPVPSSIALGTISGQINSSPLNNDYSAIQTAVNALITLVNSGVSGQLLISGGPTALSWGAPGDWWAAPSTLTYTSTDGHTFVCATGSDFTGSVGVGTRVKLTDAGTKYFVVTAITAAAVTLYGGTANTLSGGAISNPFYSNAKAPLGFDTNPVSWTEKVAVTSEVIQNGPTAGTWYNLGSSLALPIGCWDVEYSIPAAVTIGSAAALTVFSTLSTANNSETDAEFTGYLAVSSVVDLEGSLSRRKQLLLAAKTSYFLNLKTMTAATASISNESQAGKPSSTIRAVCAYL